MNERRGFITNYARGLWFRAFSVAKERRPIWVGCAYKHRIPRRISLMIQAPGMMQKRNSGFSRQMDIMDI